MLLSYLYYAESQIVINYNTIVSIIENIISSPQIFFATMFDVNLIVIKFFKLKQS